MPGPENTGSNWRPEAAAQLQVLSKVRREALAVGENGRRSGAIVVLTWKGCNPETFKHFLTRSLKSTGLDTSLSITLLIAGLGLVITTLMFIRMHTARVKLHGSSSTHRPG